MNEIPSPSVLILGYGREGQSVHRHFSVHHPDISVGIADQNSITPVVDDDASIHTGKDYLRSIEEYGVVVHSPGIPTHLPELEKARSEGKWITSATNIFFSECPGMVIGITGTKGKSTTSTLVSEIIKKQYDDVRLVGNIGNPALNYLDGATAQTIFVSELSSHQLEDSRYSPHIAIVLDIVPEHMDYYKDFNQYVSAKGQIVNNQQKNDIVIFNPNHPIVSELVERAKSRKLRFSLSPAKNMFCWIDNGVVYTKSHSGPEQILSSEDIPLLGSGNRENALAAITVGLALDVSIEKIRTAVKEFKSLEHRLEFAGEFRGIKFYNDSLATIPQATMHALEALGPTVDTLIAGGYDRGLDYEELGKSLAFSSIQNLIFFPDTGLKIGELVKKHNPNSSQHIIIVRSMEDAVRHAYELTKPGGICVMSPGSASFNLFKDYAERGRLFKDYVRKLAQD